MKRYAILITLVMMTMPWRAIAQTTQPAIGISTGIEDGKKMLHVVVTLNAKPLENVTLQYFVQRTFGRILLGEDTTLDDGSSALAFPADLPGGPEGQLRFLVKIKSPAQYVDTSTSAAFASDVKQKPAGDAFPRALWAPNAPLPLMLSIFGLLTAVWLSYLFVASQIFAILKGGKL